MERMTSPSTTTIIKMNTPNALEEPAMLPYTFWVIPETMDAKISKETQLEIHFSVINSPIRMSRTEPTVITNADIMSVPKSVGMTFPPSR